ncbi:MAG TPA: DUF362 domain-containing protein [Opitutaceae bacterium]|nr:DUF362 domain-containing protein [Opitutaceae bacterium]
MNTRRDFLKAGLALGAAAPLLRVRPLLAATLPEPAAAAPGKPVLVAVRDGSRTAMCDRALAELGGMAAFVRPGQTVVIKPNISFDTPPEHGANTHPELLRRVVTQCFEAGAKSVSIFDHTLDQWQRAYAASGAEQVAKETGAKLVPGNDASYYREVAIPGGAVLRSARVHALVLDSDVFINVPVLKDHGGALMTAAMKNLMGIVWDRRFWHRNDLDQCIADFLTWRKPALNLLDAYHPMVRNGPHGRSEADLVETRSLLASTDIVALDAAGARMLGLQPAMVRYIKIAADLKLGTMDLDQVDIRRIKLG